MPEDCKSSFWTNLFKKEKRKKNWQKNAYLKHVLDNTDMLKTMNTHKNLKAVSQEVGRGLPVAEAHDLIWMERDSATTTILLKTDKYPLLRTCIMSQLNK